MVIIVCGGRYYKDYDKVCEVLDALKPTMILHGACSGADELADRYARNKGIDSIILPANWAGRGKSAGPIRNKLMLDVGLSLGLRKVVAFPGGAGTDNMVNLARVYNVNVQLVEK